MTFTQDLIGLLRLNHLNMILFCSFEFAKQSYEK
jgi:hypothetical protein